MGGLGLVLLLMGLMDVVVVGVVVVMVVVHDAEVHGENVGGGRGHLHGEHSRRAHVH